MGNGEGIKFGSKEVDPITYSRIVIGKELRKRQDEN